MTYCIVKLWTVNVNDKKLKPGLNPQKVVFNQAGFSHGCRIDLVLQCNFNIRALSCAVILKHCNIREQW